MRTQSTSVNLLTRTGAVCCTFTPALNGDQYDELLDQQGKGQTAAEMEDLLKTLAVKWAVAIEFIPC